MYNVSSEQRSLTDWAAVVHGALRVEFASVPTELAPTVGGAIYRGKAVITHGLLSYEVLYKGIQWQLLQPPEYVHHVRDVPIV